MVEHGIIKVFFGARSVNQGRYGFIRVTDEAGCPTGEEVYFHLNQLRDVKVAQLAPYLASSRLSLSDLDFSPRKGERVVFVAQEGVPRRQVTAWTAASLWDEVIEALFWDHMDHLDEYDLTQCSGICGQTVRQCRCEEIYLREGHGNDSHLSFADVRELTEPTEN